MRLLLATLCVAWALLGSGCYFPPRQCLSVCSARHQSCVTRASSDNALQWCDYHQKRCMNQCYGREP